MSKKRMCIIIGIIIFIIAAIVFFRLGKEKTVPEKVQQQTEEQTGRKEQPETNETKAILFENVEGLYFLNSDGEALFKESFKRWVTDDVKKAEVTGVIEETDSGYVFYVLCDNGKSVRAEYQEGAFAFAWEEVDASQLDVEPEEPGKTQEEQDGILSALQEEQSQGQADQPEEAAGEVTILNKETLPETFPEGAVEKITAFLEEEGELRRAVYYEGEQEGIYTFCFQNQRADRKELAVEADKEEISVMFIDGIEEGEE